ncbi:hypothetical protein, partial [Proteus mirabilis]|uniref:hypothetical protein n=1 Tax=Proteus mirabilis TaxID=584 RepID=UPI001953147C
MLADIGEGATQALQSVPYFGALVAKPPDITQLPPQDAVFTRLMGAAGIVRAEYPVGKAVQVASCLLEKIRNAIDTFFTEQK